MTTREQYDRVYRMLREYPAWLNSNMMHLYRTLWDIPIPVIDKAIRSYIARGDYNRKTVSS